MSMTSIAPAARALPASLALETYVTGKAEPGSFEDRLAGAPVRRLDAREHLWCEGDTRSHVYRIESGAVCVYKVLPDGRRHVVDFAFAGDFVGLGLDTEHAFNAQALEPTRLKGLSIAAFNQALKDDSRLALKLYEALSLELDAARAQLLMVSKRVSTERVASFLLTLANRSAQRGLDRSLVALPMRRLDIADFLGLTIETVSRTFTKLKTQKIISLLPGNIVRIVDPARLADLASGDGEADV